MTELDTGAGLEVVAGLSLQLGRLADTLSTAGQRDHARRQRLIDGIQYIEAPVISFTTLPATGQAQQYGPNLGWVWAVQRVSVYGFGASTDYADLYRGQSTSDVQGQNYLQAFTPVSSTVLSATAWHPGRTGLILKPNETLVIGGTFTGTVGFVSSDVIQISDDCLADFLV